MTIRQHVIPVLVFTGFAMSAYAQQQQAQQSDNINISLNKVLAAQLEKIVGDVPTRDGAWLYVTIQSQITASANAKTEADISAFKNNLEKQIRDKLASDAAKAAEDKAKVLETTPQSE